ncbi:hypothetical protein D3C73_1488320 [compost metagenome]
MSTKLFIKNSRQGMCRNMCLKLLPILNFFHSPLPSLKFQNHHTGNHHPDPDELRQTHLLLHHSEPPADINQKGQAELGDQQCRDGKCHSDVLNSGNFAENNKCRQRPAEQI